MTDDVVAYYRRRAENEVGLIVSEGTGVDRPISVNDANVPRFHGDKALAGWQRVIDAVHEAGGAMAPPICHAAPARARHTDIQAGVRDRAALHAGLPAALACLGCHGEHLGPTGELTRMAGSAAAHARRCGHRSSPTCPASPCIRSPRATSAARSAPRGRHAWRPAEDTPWPAPPRGRRASGPRPGRGPLPGHGQPTGPPTHPRGSSYARAVWSPSLALYRPPPLWSCGVVPLPLLGCRRPP